MTETRWYDVPFRLEGVVQVEARGENGAEETALRLLEGQASSIEMTLMAPIGVEVGEAFLTEAEED